MHRRGSNPIIFARTETIHIPKPLEDLSEQKLQNAVYCVEKDGSLRCNRMPVVEEVNEESELVVKEEKPGVMALLAHHP